MSVKRTIVRLAACAALSTVAASASAATAAATRPARPKASTMLTLDGRAQASSPAPLAPQVAPDGSPRAQPAGAGSASGDSLVPRESSLSRDAAPSGGTALTHEAGRAREGTLATRESSPSRGPVVFESEPLAREAALGLLGSPDYLDRRTRISQLLSPHAPLKLEAGAVVSLLDAEHADVARAAAELAYRNDTVRKSVGLDSASKVSRLLNVRTMSWETTPGAARPVASSVPWSVGDDGGADDAAADAPADAPPVATTALTSVGLGALAWSGTALATAGLVLMSAFGMLFGLDLPRRPNAR